MVNELDTQKLYDFALLQMAAESYIDRAKNNQNSLHDVLKFGNNNPDPIYGLDVDDPKLAGATRITDKQFLKYFNNDLDNGPLGRYDIIDHIPNDSSGFSATLFYDNDTHEFTLSFRSTEFRPQEDGGDRERDGAAGADGSIGNYGFAFAQLAAAEKYYTEVVKPLIGTEKINVTGYSLGGHLATSFTRMHWNEVNHSYTFNAAGTGSIGKTGATVNDVVTYFSAVLLNPDHAIDIINGNPSQDKIDAYNSAKAATEPDINGNIPPDISAYDNIYFTSQYKWAAIATQAHFGTSYDKFGGITDTSFDGKITQVYGHATHDDAEYVANTGTHATAQPIFIEDQPDVTFLGGFFGDEKGDFGTTHSITLIVDSLALMNLMQEIDPDLKTPILGQEIIESIFRVSSNLRGQGGIGLDGRGEADSLENILNRLAKVFDLKDSQGKAIDLKPDNSANGFGNINDRNNFYNAIEALREVIKNTDVSGFAFTTLEDVTKETLVAKAMLDNAEGLAYRYAITEGDPFILFGADYSKHNTDHALDLYDSITGTGNITADYLEDRANFLVQKLYFADGNLNNNYTNKVNTSSAASPANTSDNIYYGEQIYFEDIVTEYKILQGSFDLDSIKHIVFGGEADNLVFGGNKDDHLYGGRGNDELNGGEGKDYLEGGIGNDTLNGNDNDDTLLGGRGNDFINGGASSDIIEGGEGIDTLVGGGDTDIIDAVLLDMVRTANDNRLLKHAA